MRPIGAQALDGRCTDLNGTDAGSPVDQSSNAAAEGAAAVVEILADADRDIAGFAGDVSRSPALWQTTGMISVRCSRSSYRP